jgi:hypothetical protein
MAHLSQLKDAGRIEVLRENRDHYHVFAFVDGARPNESLIMASLGDARAPQLRKEAHHAEKPAPKKSNKTSSTRSKRRR